MLKQEKIKRGFNIKAKTMIGLVVLAMMLSQFTIAHADPLIEEALECLLEPNTEIEISAAVSGVLSDVLVQRGDRVKRGQVLARLVSGLVKETVDLSISHV